MDELMRKAQMAEDERILGQTGIAFPASKTQLLAEARRQNLPPDVVEKLERLPDRTYSDITDLVRSATNQGS